jgi:hypothetical protein
MDINTKNLVIVTLATIGAIRTVKVVDRKLSTNPFYRRLKSI